MRKHNQPPRLSTRAFTGVVALILVSSVGVRVLIRAQVRTVGAVSSGGIHSGAGGPAAGGSDLPPDGGSNQAAAALGARSLWAVLGPAVQSLNGSGRLQIAAWSAIPPSLGGFSVLVKIGDAPHRWVRTNATTVGGLLEAMDVELASGDRVQPAADEPLAAAMTIRIDRVRRVQLTVVERVSFDTVTRYSGALSPGQVREVQAGVPGQTLRTFRVTFRNGVQVGRKLLSVVVLTDPVPRVVEKGASATYTSPLGSGGAAAAVAAAYEAIGSPYVNGGASLSGFDCSGLTMWAWAHGGVALPHSSSEQYAVTPRVASSDLRPGDLVFFYSPISHVAIYVGGGQMIMAHKTGTYVQLDTMSSYWWSVYSGAGRP